MIAFLKAKLLLVLQNWQRDSWRSGEGLGSWNGVGVQQFQTLELVSVDLKGVLLKLQNHIIRRSQNSHRSDHFPKLLRKFQLEPQFRCTFVHLNHIIHLPYHERLPNLQCLNVKNHI